MTTLPDSPSEIAPTIVLADVRRVLRVSRHTVDRMCQRNEFPRPFKVGGLRRWLRADVEKWIADRAAAAQQEGAARG